MKPQRNSYALAFSVGLMKCRGVVVSCGWVQSDPAGKTQVVVFSSRDLRGFSFGSWFWKFLLDQSSSHTGNQERLCVCVCVRTCVCMCTVALTGFLLLPPLFHPGFQLMRWYWAYSWQVFLFWSVSPKCALRIVPYWSHWQSRFTTKLWKACFAGCVCVCVSWKARAVLYSLLGVLGVPLPQESYLLLQGGSKMEG